MVSILDSFEDRKAVAGVVTRSHPGCPRWSGGVFIGLSKTAPRRCLPCRPLGEAGYGSCEGLHRRCSS